ncbi:hypothetical protein PHYPSEUDO_013446 [Phytophthora pseudosyringae]|uniref:BZIP domain-containing protein n=1 Tax=Phytophthora pseudosyringae TaxID=221518 RepID=A0A8T1WKG4_9STRA|nr:hypothetical protein PHYPSEUDO_013446 [Phytophthora pseudosyringae]
MHSPGRFRAAPRRLPRWDADPDADEDGEDQDDAFLSASDLVKTLQPVPRSQRREPPARRWPAPVETQTPPGFASDWPFDGSPGHADSRAMDQRPGSRTLKGARPFAAAAGEQLQLRAQDADEYEAARARAFHMGYELQLEPRHSQAQLQRYQQQRQYQRAMQREFAADVSSELYRRAASHPEPELYARELRGRGPADDLPFDPPRRIPRSTPAPGASLTAFGLRPNGLMRDAHARNRRNTAPPPSRFSPAFGPRVDELPLEPAMLDMYAEVAEAPTMPRRRENGHPQPPARQRMYQQMPRRPQSAERLNLNDDEMTVAARRSFHDLDLPRGRRGGEGRAVYEELVPTPTGTGFSQNKDYGTVSPHGGADVLADRSSSRQRPSQPIARPQKAKRPRPEEPSTFAAPAASATEEPAPAAQATKAKTTAKRPAASSPSDGKEVDTQPKRRCGRKSMNYSSEQKRERNRAAVKKCRQRQALKLEYLQHKAESLAAENQALSEMLVKNTDLEEEQRTSLTRGIQMDILLKIKEIFTQSLPKDFVLDADSIWDLNSVLAVSMPSRCYYGIESIKDFWRTSLRMRNKGKIRSFWAWLFRLAPGDRFSEFEIQPFSPTSNLYFISWTTKSTPPLAGSMVIMFGNGHRVTLHVECFGWLIWRYLLTNEPFPEPSME